MTMRSRDLSSIGGETDQNLPDDNMFEQEGEEAEQTDNEDNEENEESDEESGTENEAEEEKLTAQRPPPVKVSYVNLKSHFKVSPVNVKLASIPLSFSVQIKGIFVSSKKFLYILVL